MNPSRVSRNFEPEKVVGQDDNDGDDDDGSTLIHFSQ